MRLASEEAALGTVLADSSVTMKLLLIDDERNILIGMRRYFAALGHEVDCASEREEAEALASYVRYDAAIVDLCLSPGHGPDGLEVVRSIHEASPATAILVLTGFGSAETQMEALHLGAAGFLHKPRSLEEIHRHLANLIAAT